MAHGKLWTPPRGIDPLEVFEDGIVEAEVLEDSEPRALGPGSSNISFILRRTSSYRPEAPRDSFYRDGYDRTPTNPKGFHLGVDCGAPTRTPIQLPERSEMRAKGWDHDGAGHWCEWLILHGMWKGRYARFFHMREACPYRPGTRKDRRWKIGEVGCTGNCDGSHVHFELGRSPWSVARDPRWNPTNALRVAVAMRDY